jgi:hypothetical protein
MRRAACLFAVIVACALHGLRAHRNPGGELIKRNAATFSLGVIDAELFG